MRMCDVSVVGHTGEEISSKFVFKYLMSGKVARGNFFSHGERAGANGGKAHF